MHKDILNLASGRPVLRHFADGRLISVQCNFSCTTLGGLCMVIWIMHDHKLPSNLSKQALQSFKSDVNRSLKQPLHFLTLFGGDLTRSAADERLYIDPHKNLTL